MIKAAVGHLGRFLGGTFHTLVNTSPTSSILVEWYGHQDPRLRLSPRLLSLSTIHPPLSSCEAPKGVSGAIWPKHQIEEEHTRCPGVSAGGMQQGYSRLLVVCNMVIVICNMLMVT